MKFRTDKGESRNMAVQKDFANRIMGTLVLIMETVQQVARRALQSNTQPVASGNRTNGYDSVADDYYRLARLLSNGSH